MKPSHILYLTFFPIVSSFAVTADYNSSVPNVLKGSNVISETATTGHDQDFKDDTTLSDLKRTLDPSYHCNHTREKCDSIGTAIDETSGLDEHGTFITEKRRDFADFLYKLFGLPARKKPNEEKHGIGNVTPEKRNTNGKASATMRTMIGSGAGASCDKDAQQ